MFEGAALVRDLNAPGTSEWCFRFKAGIEVYQLAAAKRAPERIQDSGRNRSTSRWGGSGRNCPVALV